MAAYCRQLSSVLGCKVQVSIGNLEELNNNFRFDLKTWREYIALEQCLPDLAGSWAGCDGDMKHDEMSA